MVSTSSTSSSSSYLFSLSDASSSNEYLNYTEIKELVESLTKHKFYCRSYITNLMNRGEFPKRIYTSKLALWRKSDVLAWLRERGVVSPSEAPAE